MSLVRYEPPVNEVVTDDRYMDRLPKMSEVFARSGLCPTEFRGKPADVEVIGYSLADLGLRLTLSTLSHCYVVHGRPGYEAQLQVGIAERFGYTIQPVTAKCDDTSATVKIISPDGEMHEVTFTMDDARKAGLAAKDMYKKFPRDMLIARAQTRAIKWHASQVLLGLSGGEFRGMDDVDVADAVEPEPEMVPAGYAKTKLVETFMADYTKDRATELAKALWDEHGYGKDPITPAEFEELLDEAAIPDAEVVEEEPVAEVIDPDEAPFE